MSSEIPHVVEVVNGIVHTTFHDIVCSTNKLGHVIFGAFRILEEVVRLKYGRVVEKTQEMARESFGN
jgi:hypothetical protein